MDCTRYAEDLTAFLDGELSDADSERVRSHLHSCAACTEELRSLCEVGAFVALQSHELEPSPESWNLVRARINESAATAPSPFWMFNYRKITLATLAVVAALALGYTQHRQIQRQNLDRYIRHYVQQREAQIRVRDENNPFMESNSVFDRNPFRSEEQ